jgi:hypothetical protein
MEKKNHKSNYLLISKTLRSTIILIVFLIPYIVSGQSRWIIQNDGSIQWNIKQDIPHSDHIEMSGEQISTVLRYGVKGDGTFSFERSVIWPMLRTIPNNTHASLMQRYAIDFASLLTVNGRTLKNERVKSISLNGILSVESEFTDPVLIRLKRMILPSTDKPVVCERYLVKNQSDKMVSLIIPDQKTSYHTEVDKGVEGSYTIEIGIQKSGHYNLAPGQEIFFDAYIQAFSKNQSPIAVNVDQEIANRLAFVNEMWSNLVFESPDTTINKMFAFAKIRASESIYRTKGGLMHGPGGESYYAAIWANDQAEYVNPFFPFLGYQNGNESAINSYRHFARFMNDDFNPIPSSIVAEGTDIWNGAGDRGDAAMIAYGAARFALTTGNRKVAEELWPLIEWCLEYNRKKLNKNGVVNSDSDELEGRFPAGDANLCTSSLYYDALLSASYLGENIEINKKQIKKYESEAKQLKQNIESYFGANVMGFDTYRYYAGNNVLRAWICIPLTVNIFDRKEATINALFSPQLWTVDGLATQAGEATFWDRATLYALRGVFAAGDTERGLKFLKYYSTRRLLGEHVPYAVEAFPEGNQRHLSAESGLYCRVFIEGLFGIRPTGLNSFVLTPNLPKEWNEMYLRKVHGFGKIFDIEVKRIGQKLNIIVKAEDQIVKNVILEENSEINVIFECM